MVGLFDCHEPLLPAHISTSILFVVTVRNITMLSQDMCTSPCMEDPTEFCCWVPSVVAQLFGCCRDLHCCPDDAKAAKQGVNHSTPCVDRHATCPQLKKSLDTIGGSCLTDDMGTGHGQCRL